MNGLEGKVGIVTGAGSGIGQATAIRLASEGVSVATVDLNEAGLEKTRKSIADAGGKVLSTPCDITDEDQCESAVAGVLNEWGRLDILANVAGILRFGAPGSETKELWDQVLAVNLTGTFLMAKASMPALIEQKGCVINVASTAAERGQPWSLAYSASKGGVQALTRALATDYATAGVRVNAVVPGGTSTPLVRGYADATQQMTPAQVERMKNLFERSARPAEIAGVITFLASDDASYMTGSSVVADGGFLV